MERFAKIAAQALNQVLETPITAADLETPPDPKMGDFGFPCFKLAKQFRKGPPQVAAEILAQLQAKGAVPAELTASTAGPYVNFTVARERVVESVVGDIVAGSGLGRYGALPEKSRGSWVIEYSSPNVAKPMNIYHVRTTVLGAALDRVGRFRGYDVIAINHLGDWGKQYGFLAVAFKKYGVDINAPITMRQLVDMYVRINADAEKDPSIEAEARETFARLEKGDPEVTAVWKKCVDISLDEFGRIYKRLNVRFDHIWGESFYQPQLAPLLADFRRKGLLVESEGAWVVPVTDENGKELPPCILEKSDGATIYATRDVAAALYRMEKFHFDRMTYVVGGEQKLHFQQIFAVLKKAGMEWVSRCEHVATGLYRFKDAKMSTRKGNFVTLEDVIGLAKDRVAQLMQERANDPARAERGEVAQPTDEITEAVSIGAVVFADLHTDPIRDVEFDVERVVDFEGETGPYLQYAHTRCLSILRKARETGALATQPGDALTLSPALAARLTAPEELALIKTLGQFPLHLERTLKHSKASQLAHYLIDVVKAFGLFYRECRVLGNPGEDGAQLTQARLVLVEATRRILAQGLGLLGIPLPDRM